MATMTITIVEPFCTFTWEELNEQEAQTAAARFESVCEEAGESPERVVGSFLLNIERWLRECNGVLDRCLQEGIFWYCYPLLKRSPRSLDREDDRYEIEIGLQMKDGRLITSMTLRLPDPDQGEVMLH
jgi:hypothetical protein